MNRRDFNQTLLAGVATAAGVAQSARAQSTQPTRTAPRVPVTTDVLFQSATTQRQALHSGQYTSLELTQSYLERIRRFNPELVGFVHVDEAGALAAARAADARIAQGERTPLLGIPVGIKDLIDVGGMPTTYGSKAFEGNIARQDASSVRRLRQAGAVILGKTNTTEFAGGSPNTLRGASKNPWDLSRTAGGSSNGSGTATSAALCSVALGTDTAGSIRTPAAFNGVFGLKPTYGRVGADGIGVLSTFMDTVGPLARSAQDIANVLQVLAGFEAADLSSLDQPVPNYARATANRGAALTVGAPDTWVLPTLDPEVQAAWRGTLEALASSGVTVKKVQLPDVSSVGPIWGGLAAGDTLLWHQASFAKSGALYSEGARRLIETLRGVSTVAAAQARQGQWMLRMAMLAAMQGVDVLILPATPSPAPTEQDIAGGRIIPGVPVGPEIIPQFAMPFNVTGQPSLSVPVAMSAKGVPIGLQIVGRHFDEATVLRAGNRVQSVVPLALRPPKYAQ